VTALLSCCYVPQRTLPAFSEIDWGAQNASVAMVENEMGRRLCVNWELRIPTDDRLKKSASNHHGMLHAHPHYTTRATANPASDALL
jgi:hypothetical protein